MGVGSLQGMRSVLRNNRQLLRKTGLFKKDTSFLSSRKEYLKAAKGSVDFKTISKSELRALREKVIKNRKAESLKAWLITLVVLVPIIVYGFYISNKYSHRIKQKIQTEKLKNDKAQQILLEQNQNKKLNRYSFIINDGDQWIEKKNWNNAIYRYKEAVELFPDEFEANYRLALAYSYHCQYKNKDCEIGKMLTIRLLKYFPEKVNLIELKNVFEK